MNHYTTIEQLKHLLELGIKAETADMVFQYGQHPEKRYVPQFTSIPWVLENSNLFEPDEDIPCWSVGALLELMPTRIESPEFEESFMLQLDKCLDKTWYISYTFEDYVFKLFRNNLCEVVYEMTKWLLQNNYIKTE